MNTFKTIDISALNTITGGVVSGVNRVGVGGVVDPVGVNNNNVGVVGSVNVNRNPVVGTVGKVFDRKVVTGVGGV